MRLPKLRLHSPSLLATLAFLTALSASAQENAEEIDVFDSAPSQTIEMAPPNQASFLIEYFQLGHRTANKLIREFSPKAANAGDLRNLLGEMVASGDATLIETAWIRAKTGMRAKSESIREDIYATEYDPPEIPNSVGDLTILQTEVTVAEKKTSSSTRTIKAGNSQGTPLTHLTSATPTAFETRHVGLTVEIDPVVGAGGSLVDINIAPEIIDRLAEQYFTNDDLSETARGIEHISMPLFYTMRTTTQLATVPGKYNILGFHTPHDQPDDRIIALIKTTTFRAH